MDVSVILCTHNRSAMLRGALDALVGQTGMEGRAWEIIVVDNNSTDDTPAVVRAAAATSSVRVRYLFEGGAGKSFALNAGLAAAAGRILAFTDDDVQLTPGWLAALVDVMERFGCEGAGGPVVPVWRSERPSWVADDGPYRMQAAIVDFRHGVEPVVLEAAPLGANSAYRRDTFERFGLFRTDLGHVGRRPLPCEDTEFARRVQRGGGELRYAPGAVVYHDVEPARLDRRYFLEWYAARGRAEMVEALPPETAVWYADVPRYLYRSLALAVARWTFSVGKARRFFYKLQTYQIAGAMAQARALRRASRHG